MLSERPSNWLPVPSPREGGPKEPFVSEEDLFSKGEIAKYFPQQEYGFIRDKNGRDLYFHLGELDLIGPKGKREYLKVGGHVGYDVSWTSHGLHVRKLKIY